MSIDGGLRPLFRQNLRQFMWTSIETGSTHSGVPDSHYICDGASGFAEFKQTDANRIKSLNPFQAAWLSRYARCGGRAWIACRRRHHGGPRLGDPVDELWMVPGILARELRAGGLLSLAGTPLLRDENWLAGAPGGPARWPWDRVAVLLAAPAGPGAQNGSAGTPRAVTRAVCRARPTSRRAASPPAPARRRHTR